MNIYLNGIFKPRKEATISVDDRGFLFGDGIYEVLRCVNGRLFRLDSHLRRLDRGIRALSIGLSEAQRADLPEIMQKLIEMNHLQDQDTTIYMQITRGASSPRSHAYPAEETPPTIMISATPFQPNTMLHQTGAHAITVPDVRWSRCDLKTVNLLPNVMIAQQAKERNVFGTIMIRDGIVTEGYNNNVFMVIDGTMYTHPDSPYILSGITREVILEFAEKAGIPVALVPVRESEVFYAREVILTGTTTDIQPVIRINDRTVGDGEPGPVTRLLQEELVKQMF